MAGKKGCISGVVALVVVLIVVVVGGLVAALFYIDQLAKGAIEVAGTRVLGVQTTVDSVSIGLMSGTADLKQLNVANPSGFQAKEFMQLGSGGIAVTPASVMSDVVRIPKVELSNLSLQFEEKAGGESNVAAILANVKKFSSSSPEAKSDEGGKKFVIDEFTLTNITVTARPAGIPLAGQGITIKVPKVQLKDIGSGGKDPVGMNQLSGLIITTVMQAVLDASGGQLPAVFAQGIANGLGDIGGAFTKGVGSIGVDLGKGLQGLGGNVGGAIGKSVEDAAKGVGKGVEDAAKNAGDAIKNGVDGLFKKK
ncbi:MAG: hypothetical protein U0572_05565 [Phycisphaerales bacterium]